MERRMVVKINTTRYHVPYMHAEGARVAAADIFRLALSIRHQGALSRHGTILYILIPTT